MPFVGVPLDEELFRSACLKEFHSAYGKEADPTALYELQPTWYRFAAAYPRQAFLLESLWGIYGSLHNVILDFAQLLTRVDPEGNWHKIGMKLEPDADPFSFFCNSNVEVEEHVSLLQLSWAFHQHCHGRLDYLLREFAREFFRAAKAEDRAAILEELLVTEGDVATALRACGQRTGANLFNARRGVKTRDQILRDTLERIQKVLDSNEGRASEPQSHPVVGRSAQGPGPQYHHPYDHLSPIAESVSYEYGNGSVSETRRGGRVTHFAESPTRSRSPPAFNRRENMPVLSRSQSRDSVRSSVYPGSSISTIAPEIPEDRFSASIKVFSASSQGWVDTIANYDTGCDAGNFISSSFVEDILRMGEAIEEDPDADSTRIMDIGGSTTFRPRGRIKLTWYGRNLHKGRKGKRSEEFTGWFYVAPRPPAEQSEEPFQILLGKDFIDENEIFTYRGFRLFRIKKQSSQEDSIELDRRQRLRQEMEDERRIERQTSDAASIMTGTSVSSPSIGGMNGSPRSSSQSLAATSAATNGSVVNVLGAS
jgi:hypothetical protein